MDQKKDIPKAVVNQHTKIPSGKSCTNIFNLFFILKFVPEDNQNHQNAVMTNGAKRVLNMMIRNQNQKILQNPVSQLMIAAVESLANIMNHLMLVNQNVDGVYTLSKVKKQCKLSTFTVTARTSLAVNVN